MIVVADASPLIFLGKIGHLALIGRLFSATLGVPESVCDEVLSGPLIPAEEQALRAFLATCTVSRVRQPKRYAAALSGPDNEVLTLAVRRRAEWLLADDRLLRRMAMVEGVRPLGTLGILVRAAEQGLLTRPQARACLEDLVQRHQFRIGIEVYAAAHQRLGA